MLRFRLDGVITLVDAVNGMSTLDSHMAVSYTHLDVYKRQDNVSPWPERCPLPCRGADN